MLQPKRVKYRRPHSLSYEGIATKGNTVEFGEWGLQALEGAYLTDRQIESARIVLARYTDRAGKIWIRVFPHLAKTKKPAEVRMGSGKGSPEGWVAVCKEGRVIFEIGGINDELALKALHQAGYKLPVKTKIIARTKALSEEEKEKMEEAHASTLEAIENEDHIETVSDTGNEPAPEEAATPASDTKKGDKQ